MGGKLGKKNREQRFPDEILCRMPVDKTNYISDKFLTL